MRDSRGRVERVDRRVVYGDPVDVQTSLILSNMKNINTSYVERQNLSVRNAAKRFTWETICFPKDGLYLSWYLELLQAWFNFAKLHHGLTTKSNAGQCVHRTPAMAQGLANRPMTWKDLLRWRCD